MIATARIIMPATMVRLSAGRLEYSQEAQALMFAAGANSIFTGDTLLTTPNPEVGPSAPLSNALPHESSTIEVIFTSVLSAFQAHVHRRFEFGGSQYHFPTFDFV